MTCNHAHYRDDDDGGGGNNDMLPAKFLQRGEQGGVREITVTADKRAALSEWPVEPGA
jgi:hypothetical protein